LDHILRELLIPDCCRQVLDQRSPLLVQVENYEGLLQLEGDFVYRLTIRTDLDVACQVLAYLSDPGFYGSVLLGQLRLFKMQVVNPKQISQILGDRREDLSTE
jgi:hypothetical protein